MAQPDAAKIQIKNSQISSDSKKKHKHNYPLHIQPHTNLHNENPYGMRKLPFGVSRDLVYSSHAPLVSS